MLRNVILLMGMAVTMAGFSQRFKIEGTAPSGVLKVYMRNFESSSVDSAYVSEGKFFFVGDAKEKRFARVFTIGNRAVDVHLSGDLCVDLVNCRINGSAENAALQQWGDSLNAAEKELTVLQQTYRYKQQEGASEEVLKNYTSRYNEAAQRLAAQLKHICLTYTTQDFPALFLLRYANMLELQDLLQIADEQPNFLKLSILKLLNQYINGQRLHKPGTPVADFALADKDGRERSISEFVGKGKYVLIDFWASWCGPCRKELPAIKKLYDAYKEKGFDIVSISLDTNKKAWMSAIEKYEMTWHHLSDLKGWECSAANLYGINAIPATLLFDPQGKILVSGLNAEELKVYLEQSLH